MSIKEQDFSNFKKRLKEKDLRRIFEAKEFRNIKDIIYNSAKVFKEQML